MRKIRDDGSTAWKTPYGDLDGRGGGRSIAVHGGTVFVFHDGDVGQQNRIARFDAGTGQWSADRIIPYGTYEYDMASAQIVATD